MLRTKDYKHFEIINSFGEVQKTFEGAEIASRALPEDRVMMTDAGKLVILERAPKKNLVGVLQLTSKYMYGMTGHGVPMYLCEPYDKSYPAFRVACKEKDRSQNLIVVFQFETWELGNELPRGALVQVLGPVEQHDVERAAIAWHSSPWSTPRPEKLREIQYDRQPILTLGTFNIDPPGCKDIDDVITLEKDKEKDIWKLWITIADVTEIVQYDSKEYLAAQKIAATTYHEGYAVRPMFHKEISEDRCSLLPGQTRYGVSLYVEWSGEGKGFIGEPKFENVLVQNQESYTYESIYKSKTVPLDILQAICSEIAGRKLTDSHEWVEYLMIFYNRHAAKVLDEMNFGLLRIHDKPFQEKLDALQKIDPKLQFLAYQSAKYVATSEGGSHWGLQEELYCHATSPLRRFADFINQQVIKDFVDGVLYKRDYDAMIELAYKLNRRQKEISSAERYYTFLKAVQEAEKAEVEGTFLWNEKGKSVFWIDSWKTSVRILTAKDFTGGQQVKIAYYCDRRKASWKDRIILSLVE